LTHILSNKKIKQINTEPRHIEYGQFTSAHRDLKKKIQLTLNRYVTISHDRPYLITTDSTKQMWLHSNMYFQINESISAMYLFITYYPFMELFLSRTKVNTLLLSSPHLFLDTPDLITWYIIFVPCEIFISPYTKQSFSKYY
jgi:hypothetical protein